MLVRRLPPAAYRTIGSDVLIAPLSFVNFDVPDHSIVVGNPAKIIRRENATEAYIDNRV